jgi:protein-S-isoprenylcysteine O-methyltransferase Ste14
MAAGVSTRRIALQLITGVGVLGAALFGTAGTLKWVEGWAYLLLQTLFSLLAAFWLKRNNPDLLRERMTFLKKTGKSWDKVIVLAMSVTFIPYLVLAGLDGGRYHWSHVPPAAQLAGFAGIVLAFILFFQVMRVNTYLSRIVEIQKERGHRVVTTGPYRYVRHPMYASATVLFLCIPLALGSLWALVPGGFLVVLIVVRTYLEDRTLHRELAGYDAYAQRVRYRLIPGIW